MLKKFFISMLGTMAGIWLSLFILMLGSVIAIGILIGKSVSTNVKTGQSVLYIDLTGTINERQAETTLMDIVQYADESTEYLETILDAITMAADDKDIKGIYINCNDASLGIASRGEIIDRLKDFKQKGKWVYAYADNYAQADYYVASAADKVFLNPVGSLDIHGLSSTAIFFKDLLDKLGIDVNIVRVGSFKSAVEPFMRMDMSEPSRLQTSVYLNQIWGEITKTIADNRGIKNVNIINQWADSLSLTWDPERYVAQKAVTALKYRSEVEDMIRDLVDIDSDAELPLVTPSEYMENKLADRLSKADDRHIAVLYAVGDIVDSGEGGIVGEDMVPAIRELANNDDVAGLILRVNSGGGSAFASEQIWHALEQFKETGKPFYVSMGDYAASGGYYISCGADVIYSDPATLTGSIGIFGIIPNAKRLLTDKIGLGFSTVETSPNASFPTLYTAPSAEQLAGMQTYVERGYETFTSRVAQGRNIPVDSVKAIGGGRVWDGISALNIGLVDKLGGLQEVINAMADELSLSHDAYVSYPKIENTLLETILKQSKGNLEVGAQGLTPEELETYHRIINKVRNMSTLQTRMENILIY